VCHMTRSKVKVKVTMSKNLQNGQLSLISSIIVHVMMNREPPKQYLNLARAAGLFIFIIDD